MKNVTLNEVKGTMFGMVPFTSFRVTFLRTAYRLTACTALPPYRLYRPSDLSTSRSNCTDRLSRREYGPGR